MKFTFPSRIGRLFGFVFPENEMEKWIHKIIRDEQQKEINGGKWKKLLSSCELMMTISDQDDCSSTFMTEILTDGNSVVCYGSSSPLFKSKNPSSIISNTWNDQRNTSLHSVYFFFIITYTSDYTTIIYKVCTLYYSLRLSFFLGLVNILVINESE